MNTQRIEAFFERECELLTNRDIDSLMALCRTPLPLFHSGGIRLITTSASLRVGFESIFEGMDRIGAVRVGFRIHEVRERQGGFATLHDFMYFDDEDHLLRTSRMRYFLDDGEDGLAIVMGEYLQVAFAGILERMRQRLS